MIERISRMQSQCNMKVARLVVIALLCLWGGIQFGMFFGHNFHTHSEFIKDYKANSKSSRWTFDKNDIINSKGEILIVETSKKKIEDEIRITKGTSETTKAITTTTTTTTIKPIIKDDLDEILEDGDKKNENKETGFKEEVSQTLNDGRLMDDVYRYTSKGNNLPIMMVAYNRPDMMDAAIQSLLNVRHVVKENVWIIQDGALESVAEVAKKHGVMLHQNKDNLHLRGGIKVDGAERIAQHYKYALSFMFDKAAPKAPAVIIVEDDLLFSPDLVEYFQAFSPALVSDPSLWIISAWNDNGFDSKVSNLAAVRRTEFFPGLGWLLTRRLYKNELEQKWPHTHWDHWMRSEKQHQSRETLFPEVSRTYHAGKKGTFMDDSLHNQYFATVDYNTNQDFVWDAKTISSSFDQVQFNNYEKYIVNSIKEAGCLNKIEELQNPTFLRQKRIALWYYVPETDTKLRDNYEFRKIASKVGIWHEPVRGSHKSFREFDWLGSKRVMLIDIQEQSYSKHRGSCRSFVGSDFSTLPDFKQMQEAFNFLPSLPLESEYVTPFPHNIAKEVKIVAGAQPNIDCFTICQNEQMTCDTNHFFSINNCQSLAQHFPCEGGCLSSIGADQPAYVVSGAPAVNLPTTCLYSEKNVFDCYGKYPVTRRFIFFS